MGRCCRREGIFKSFGVKRTRKLAGKIAGKLAFTLRLHKGGKEHIHFAVICILYSRTVGCLLKVNPFPLWCAAEPTEIGKKEAVAYGVFI